MTKLKIRVLWHVSALLCVLFLSSIGVNWVLAQTHTDYYDRNAITPAQHEQLKAEVAVNTAEIESRNAVLQQRLTDDEVTIRRNTQLVDEHSMTINRMEGIGISFGLALTIVQYMLFRAHQENRQDGENKRASGEHRAASGE